MNTELERAVHGHLCIGFAGTSLDDDLRAWLDRGLGGVIAFAHNAESRAQVAELMGQIREHAGRPILRAVDQEGGRVARLREGFSVPGPMAEVGASGDENAALAHGRLIGGELADVGFNLALAPVLDLATNRDSRVIGDRSLGADARMVSTLGAGVIRGIQACGVMACAKHFPGHGDTPDDSHLTLPRVATPRRTIRSRELLPFIAAIRAGVDCVMPGHLIVEAYDAEQPATVSPAVLTELLRGDLDFKGLVVSDDLEMAAIKETMSVERAAIEALCAGVDVLLVGHDQTLADRVVRTLIAAVEDGELDATRLLETAARIHRSAGVADRRIAKLGE
ncbi:MAG: beta-N-acetylhexosaminidase [Planctomycetota bacterium]